MCCSPPIHLFVDDMVMFGSGGCVKVGTFLGGVLAPWSLRISSGIPVREKTVTNSFANLSARQGYSLRLMRPWHNQQWSG